MACCVALAPQVSLRAPGAGPGNQSTKGESNRSAGTCAGCGKPARRNGGDGMLTAGKDVYHESCFNCSVDGCAVSLASGYAVEAGAIYCLDHDPHKAKSLGSCRRCDQPVLVVDGGESALGRVWHPACLVCFECCTPVLSQEYFPGGAPGDEVPYCKACHADKFGPACAKCGQGSHSLNDLPQKNSTKLLLCNPCFACHKCGAGLKGKKFYHGKVVPFSVYCEEHKHLRKPPKGSKANTRGQASPPPNCHRRRHGSGRVGVGVGSADKAEKVFAIMDQDGNGTIDKFELVRVAQWRGGTLHVCGCTCVSPLACVCQFYLRVQLRLAPRASRVPCNHRQHCPRATC